jgi:FixJ family two-component response regulator
VKPLIQIVEDDDAIRDSLKLLLEARGYNVETYGSGTEFFDDGDPARCKCLILDVNLPGETGFEVLARLRKRGLETPAIFVSGRATAAVRAQAMRAQAAAFFDKPVPPTELLAAIAKATQGKA